VASATRALSGVDRDAQSDSGFLFDESLTLRRHDCSVNIAGGLATAQLTSDHAVANGIHLPTKRRACARGPTRRPISEMLMVWIDISEVSFS
jgi:hypothetical protein